MYAKFRTIRMKSTSVKIIALTIFISVSFTSCSNNKPLDVKQFYGIWVNYSLYTEMKASHSLFGSQHFIYDRVTLTLNDTSWLNGYSDGLDFTIGGITKNTIGFRNIGESNDLFTLVVLNDSTLEGQTPYGEEIMVFRKFNYAKDFPKCDYDEPFEYYLKRRYFRETKRIIISDNPNKSNEVSFPTSCKVKGFLNYTGYDIILGGTEGSPNGDIVSFNSADTKTVYFNFIISSDSIYLYNITTLNDINSNKICDSLDIDLVQGKLMYILVHK